MSIAKPRVTALPRDPSCLVIFWEIPAADTAPRNDGEASASASLALRIADTTFRLYDGTNANDIHDIPITGAADHLYVRVEGKSGRTLTVDLGHRTATGQWVTLARAKPAEMPRRSVASARPPMWMTVTPTAAVTAATAAAAVAVDRSAPNAVTPLAASPASSSRFGAHRRRKEKPLQRPIEDRQIKIVRPTTRRLPTKTTPASATATAAPAAQYTIHHGPATIGTEWLETTTEWPAELPPDLTAANAVEKLTHRLLGRLGVHRWRESWRADTRVFYAELGKAQVPWPRAVPLERASHLELVVAAKRRVFRADDGRWMAMVGPWHIGIFADTTLAPRRLDAWSVTLTWTSESPVRDDEMRRVYGMIFGSPESPRPLAPEIPAHPPQTTPAVGFTVLPRDPHEFRPPTPAHAPPASVPASFAAENHELGGGASEQPASGAGRADIVGFMHRVLETAAAAAVGGPLDTPSSGEQPMIATSMGREVVMGRASETNAISAESSAGVVLGAIPIPSAPEKWTAIPGGLSSEQFFGISSEQPHLDTSSNISSSSESHAEAPNWFRAVWLPALAAGASEQFAVPSSEQFHQVGGASEIWAAHWMAGEFPAASENLIITAPRESQIMPGSSEAFAFPAASENFLGASEAFMAASENFLGASEAFMAASENFLGASEAFAFPGASEQFVGASAQFMLGRATGPEAEHGPGAVEVGGEKWVTLGSTQTPTADPGDASTAAEAHAPAWRHQPAGELPTIVAALAAGALVTPSEPQTATTASSPSATVPAAASSAPPVAAAAAPVVVPSAPASSPAQPAAAAAVTSPLRAPSTTATTTPSAAPPPTTAEAAAATVPPSAPASTSTTTTQGSPSSTLEFHPPATELSAANLMPELRQLLNGLGIASIVLSAVAAAVAVSAPIVAVFVLVGALAAVLLMWRKRTEAGQAADDMPVPMIGLLMFAVATPFVVVLATGFTGVTAAVLSLLIIAAEIALIGPLLTRHHSPPPPPPHQPR